MRSDVIPVLNLISLGEAFSGFGRSFRTLISVGHSRGLPHFDLDDVRYCAAIDVTRPFERVEGSARGGVAS